MPRLRPDGTHYPSMMPKICAECGKPGTARNHVVIAAGVYAHKACRVVVPMCKEKRCELPAKSNGRCTHHFNVWYYQSNRDREKARSAAWYHGNPDKVAERYQREKAAGVHRRQATRWYWANRMQALAMQHNLRAVLRDLPGRVTAAQLTARFEYFGGCCYLCGGAADGFDHVKPLAAGGANFASNLRPACGPCNSRKHIKWNGVNDARSYYFNAKAG